jgi:stage II sporulation protein R
MQIVKTAFIRRTALLCAAAAALAVTVSACSSVELEEKQFPLFAAVQAEGDSYRILYEPSEETKQLDYNHLKVMVLEEAFLADADAYESLLTDIQEEDTYPRNTYVCVTADAEALRKLQEQNVLDLGEYLEELLENGTADPVKDLPTIGKLIDEKENRQKTLYLPYLVVDGDSVVWDGEYEIFQSVPQGVLQEQMPLTAETDSQQEQTADTAQTDSQQEQTLDTAQIDPQQEQTADTAQTDPQQEQAADTAQTDSQQEQISDPSQTDPLQPQIAQKILRFHVLANSDSLEDQGVKLKVRDAVGTLMADKLADADDLAASRQIVEDNLDAIRQTAEETLEKEGYDYGATVSLSTVEFPEKTYGAFTFPAGKYEALELVLGEGGGHNWWCVLYPNLCFRGSVYEVVDKDAAKKLREVLTPEEYEDVFDSGRFEIRLKFLEHFRKNS